MPDLVEKGIAPALSPNWDRNDPASNWYLGARKLNDERRAIFLAKLEEHGRIGIACRWAGVNRSTVNDHRKMDPDFDAACKEAEYMYHEMCAAGILQQARMGQIDERYDKEGNLLSRRVSYETRLREMIVKRADPSYNDVSKQEVSVVGGAVIVPAPVDGVETWDDVVRRMSGQTVGGELANEPGNVGPKALSEGRVVKRTVVETLGTEVSEGKIPTYREPGSETLGTEVSEGHEPVDDSERPADK